MLILIVPLHSILLPLFLCSSQEHVAKTKDHDGKEKGETINTQYKKVREISCKIDTRH